VVRYVERNALRASLVERAQDWPWGSMANSRHGPSLDQEVFPRKEDWPELVNAPISEADEEVIRLSITRDRPYGPKTWVEATATRLGLEYSIRPRGRPGPKSN
jgi:putative transposase